ncbi:MAG: hypothetical protein IJX98_00290 [Clostridia bacterium]|nr:hypothetical protein [Clostridia bacterium]
MKHYSAILQMYNGQRGKFEDVPLHEDYLSILDSVIKEEKNLQTKLQGNQEALDLHVKITNLLDELDIVGKEAHFREGFRFGVLMGLDIAGFFDEKEE